ncbi:MAG: hypothetical protein JJU45_09350 [Acidimicrobiia bacterium]|nr:hypothetical protein [Acidimicrobiia bacterium]
MGDGGYWTASGDTVAPLLTIASDDPLDEEDTMVPEGTLPAPRVPPDGSAPPEAETTLNGPSASLEP